MKRVFPSNYTRKLLDQDPNKIVDLESCGCSLPNDYKDWTTLSSKVKKRAMTSEEREKYFGEEDKDGNN